VLPAAQRLTHGDVFRHVVRTGARAATPTLVVHLVAQAPADHPGTAGQVGFVVSKAVGNAVARTRVKRRLRHQCRDLLSAGPASGVVVVRALPAAARASSADLARDLASGLRRAREKAGAVTP